MVEALLKELRVISDKKRADFLLGFFNTKDRAKEDLFLGIKVPELRKIAVKYNQLKFEEIQKLIASKYHEERLMALFILVRRFEKGDSLVKEEVFKFYINNKDYINHWDLVDSSADRILGEYLIDKPRDILYELANSKIWWERRISIIAAYQFIKKDKEYKETFALAKLLLKDEHDLVQKAVGWMLREVGKRISQDLLIEFLDKNSKDMPRTMLRYAIEKLPENKRKYYLSK